MFDTAKFLFKFCHYALNVHVVLSVIAVLDPAGQGVNGITRVSVHPGLALNEWGSSRLADCSPPSCCQMFLWPTSKFPLLPGIHFFSGLSIQYCPEANPCACAIPNASVERDSEGKLSHAAHH